MADAQNQPVSDVSEQNHRTASHWQVIHSASPQMGEDDVYDPLRKFLTSSHDPEAEALMDSAEEAFYGGNYQKAIPLYEKVLAIEPSWSRPGTSR